MSQQLTTTSTEDVLSSVVIHGDLSKLTDTQKVIYYRQFCDSLGLNPLTQPFAIIKFQGKEVLYAKKDATEQLRKVHGISVTDLTGEVQHDSTYVVTCKVRDKQGKTDIATGVVALEGLKGAPLSNAKMVAETKAKRRATLSICGLGMMDESEIGTVDGSYVTVDVPVQEKSSAKPPLTDKAFGQAVERIQKGEKGLIEKLRQSYALSQAQIDTLVGMEDANIVSA